MNEVHLDTAILECRRFLARAEKAMRLTGTELICGCRETADVRRASMDLTRALADLRRGSDHRK